MSRPCPRPRAAFPALLPALLLPALLLSAALPALAGQAGPLPAVRSLSLAHRPAEALLPAARALLGPQGRAVAEGRRLILRGPAPLLAQVLPALRALDRPPRRLRLALRSGRGSPPLGPGALRRWSTQGGGERRRELLLLEGRPAALEAGQLLPYTELAATGPPEAPGWLVGLAHLPATARLQVRAWLLDGEALLELEAWGTRPEQLGPRDPLGRHELGTAFRLPLGRWTLLAAQGAGGLRQDAGARRLRTGEGDRGWWLAAEVEAAP